MSCFRDVPWKLYCSRAIAAWGDRMWMFAVGLFMVDLSPGSLKWPAIYGLSQSLAVVFAGSLIGRWVDQTPRWSAARGSLAAQNVMVIICAICVTLTFTFKENLITYAEEWCLAGACSLIVILGTLAHLASVASSIVVYKDWVAIIAGSDTQALSRMNSTCRSIDLAINMIAPIAVGQIMFFVSHIVAAIVIAAWNVISFFIEYFLLWNIYKDFPNLKLKNIPAVSENLLQDKVKGCHKDDKKMEDIQKTGSKGNFLSKRVKGFFTSWQIYFHHNVRNAGIGLACLYMTVLGFDSITIGYAYSQGVPESLLGILLAIGAGTGLLGSVVFPSFVRHLGVERTGLCGFGLEVICLVSCVVSVWSPGSPFDPGSVFNLTIKDPFVAQNSSTDSKNLFGEGPDSYFSVTLLMTGIIAARFGLWIADLSVNQVLQGVEDKIRGTINGVQNSINMIFNTAKFVLVIICPWPQTYGILVCISFTAICVGWSFFASYTFKMRTVRVPQAINNITSDQIQHANVDKEKAQDADVNEVLILESRDVSDQP